MQFNSQFSYETRQDHSFYCDETQMTVQEDATDCDILTIIKRYSPEDIVNSAQLAKEQFADVSNISDYQTSLNFVMNAQERFLALPAEIRNKFDNDPQNLLHAFDNMDKYRADLEELGLVPKSSEPQTSVSASVDSNESGPIEDE